MTTQAHIQTLPLPDGIRSRTIGGINGLSVHLLEAGYQQPGRPCVLLLHGFPELAFSWRKTMPALAAAGYHVVAPDQRGYGRTTGWDNAYDGDLAPFRLLNLVRDVVGLVAALGIRKLAAVVGHDFGARVAAWCALVRPDMFERLVLMSVPFTGAPALPFDTGRNRPTAPDAAGSIHRQLAALAQPRKDYQLYFGTREANRDMLESPAGLHAFLRAYYHVKSADNPANDPHPLRSGSATEMAKLPGYYVMDLFSRMDETVLRDAPSAAQVASNTWLTDDELAVYSQEYARTGFQGGLQCYRCGADPALVSEMQLYSGATIDIPSMFIAGEKDWGIYKKPGDFEAMPKVGCTDMGTRIFLLENAGHWVQQEQPHQVNRLLTDFLKTR